MELELETLLVVAIMLLPLFCLLLTKLDTLLLLRYLYPRKPMVGSVLDSSQLLESESVYKKETRCDDRSQYSIHR